MDSTPQIDIPDEVPNSGDKPICLICNRVYASRKNFKIHMQKQHTLKPLMAQKQTFSCTYCERTFQRLGPLKLHVQKMHSLATKILCSDCDFLAPTVADLKSHFKIKHQLDRVNKYSCKQCDFTADFVKEFKDHILTSHSLENDFVCHFCPYQTTTIEDLNLHNTRNHKQELSNQYKQYSCLQCDFKAESILALDAHQKLEHSDFKNVVKLEVIESEVENQSENPYKCLHCSFNTNLIEDLISHSIKHIAEKQHIKQEIIIEEEQHSTGPIANEVAPQKAPIYKYQCTLCSFGALKALEYSNHVKKAHKSDDHFKCSMCDFENHSQIILRKHVYKTHGKVYGMPSKKTHISSIDNSINCVLNSNLKGEKVQEFEKVDLKTEIKEEPMEFEQFSIDQDYIDPEIH